MRFCSHVLLLAAEYIEINRGSVEIAMPMVDGRRPDQPPRLGFRSPNIVGSTGSRSGLPVQRIQRPPDIPLTHRVGRQSPQQLPSDMFTQRLPPPPPQLLRVQTRIPPRPPTLVFQVRRPGPQQLPRDVFTQRLPPLPPQPLRAPTLLPHRLPLPLPLRAPPPPGPRPYLPLAEPRMIPPRQPLLRRPSERRGQRHDQRERRRRQERRSRGQIGYHSKLLPNDSGILYNESLDSHTRQPHLFHAASSILLRNTTFNQLK